MGPEVREAFMTRDPAAQRAFRASGEKFYADLWLLARQRLAAQGVASISGADAARGMNLLIFLPATQRYYRPYGKFDLADITLRHKTIRVRFFHHNTGQTS